MAGAGRYGRPHWRRVVAVLANSDARTAYAQIVLGAAPGNAPTELKHQQLNGRRLDRAIENLLGSGLVERTAAGGLVAPEAIFRDLLAQQPGRQAPTGAARFLRLGRIERYPANRSDRHELLAWIVNEAIRPGEHLTETQVNERLLSYTEDVVLLRRYLVDFGLLERTASGSSYSRPQEP